MNLDEDRDEADLALDIDEDVQDDAPADEPDPAVETDETGETAETGAGDGQDDDLPDDPAELRRIARERGVREREARELASRFEAIAVGRTPPQTPTAKPERAEGEDEFQPHLDAAYRELAEHPDDPDPKVMRKALLALTGVVLKTRESVKRSAQDSEAMGSIPAKHLQPTREIAARFGIPLTVAHQLYKGKLYDDAVAKRREGGGKAKPAAPETPPARGQSKPTAMRPAPPKPPGASGNILTLPSGLKVNAVQTPETYAKLMDDLAAKEAAGDRSAGVARREIYRHRSDGKITIRTR